MLLSSIKKIIFADEKIDSLAFVNNIWLKDICSRHLAKNHLNTSIWPKVTWLKGTWPTNGQKTYEKNTLPMTFGRKTIGKKPHDQK